MKKNYLFGALALCGLLTFTSCGSDEDPILDGPNNEVATGEQVIVLDMQNTDVLSTKSRPLFSTENKGSKEVTDVVLYIFKQGDQDKSDWTLSRVISVPNWNNTCEKYKYGHKKTIKLGGDGGIEKLTTGTYTIVAVGQNETKMTPAPFTFAGKDGNGGVTIPGLAKEEVNNQPSINFASTPGDGFPYLLTDPVSYKTKAGAFNSQAVGEVFSGQSDPVTFEASAGFSATVLLKRQVAGVLGYFINIPAAGNALDEPTTECWSTKLRLVSSNRNDRIDMTILLKDQNDDATEIGDENTVNGFKAQDQQNNPKEVAFKDGADAYTIYEIDLKKWFKMPGDNKGWESVAETVDGKMYLGKTSAWKNYLEGTNAGVTVEDGSVLAGEFVIPFDKDPDLNTFELQLIGKKKGTDKDFDENDKDEHIIQTWAVKLDKESIEKPNLKDTEKNYNIYRNHLYQIGKRGDGDSPTNPGEDPDKPQPLDKSQELVIKINDNWEFIHDMEID